MLIFCDIRIAMIYPLVLTYNCSKQLKPLNVIMEGKPASKSDQDPVLGPVERVRLRDLAGGWLHIKGSLKS